MENKEECSCTDECLGYLTKTCKGLEEYKEEKFYSRKDVLNLLDFVNDRLPDLYSRFNPEEELEEWHKFEIK